MAIDKALLKEIDGKLLLVDSDPSSKELSALVMNSLEQDSLTQSNLIEGIKFDKRTLREMRKKRFLKTSCLNSAFNYSSCNFEGNITYNLIIETAKRIDPNLNYITDYRTENVRIQGTDTVMPPRAEKVKETL